MAVELEGGLGEPLAPEMVAARRRALGGATGEDGLICGSGDGVLAVGGLAGRFGGGRSPS